jgi:hypothetical protein
MNKQQAGTHSKGVLRKDTAQKSPSLQPPKAPSTGLMIEDDVPVPSKRYVRVSKYPFGEMLPGQSCLVPNKTYSAVIGVLRRHKALGKKFTVRKLEEGIRVWRDE